MPAGQRRLHCRPDYRIYSNKRREAYLKTFRASNAALIPVNMVLAQVTGHGKRKREVGVVLPAKFRAFTTDLRIARIFNGRAVNYNHFELKNIAFDKKNSNAVLSLVLICRRTTCDTVAGTAWDTVPTYENIRRRQQQPSQAFAADVPAKLT